ADARRRSTRTLATSGLAWDSTAEHGLGDAGRPCARYRHGCGRNRFVLAFELAHDGEPGFTSDDKGNTLCLRIGAADQGAVPLGLRCWRGRCGGGRLWRRAGHLVHGPIRPTLKVTLNRRLRRPCVARLKVGTKFFDLFE